ncbi:hypothetical protein NG798_22315 [Ancylothrix sp. C2]|uniref:hypothetical protein n=1 Tax=Ancylothrix sp. D3o TaxID=2953691 RepID=UPI0021BA5FF6|nr:hypothetical protein [Ancylothrix sp. D3o]MCT7952534.1 hypothetical protein [Ancylothrix sp. D3o]
MTRVNMIRKLVRQVMKTGYLSLDTEQQIKHLFHVHCNIDDLDALVTLQNAVTAGHVKREATQTKQQCLVH